MTFDNLSEGQFEEFIYDLLDGLGFVNLSWRRGSGKGGPSPDQGRDIVGKFHRRDVDKTERLETWFVQCKHYKQGVPPEVLEGALAWSSAERPSVIVFAVSNFLSNPAKNWLELYEQNNRPPFQVKVWERKDLERLVASYPKLVLKYQLKAPDSIAALHPAHLLFFHQTSPFISLDFFFDVLDSTDANLRDTLFDQPYHSIINPRFRNAVTGDEKPRELMVDKVDYASFRNRCYLLKTTGLDERFLVSAIIFEALGWAHRFADPSMTPVRIAVEQMLIAHFTSELEAERDEERIVQLRKSITSAEDRISMAHKHQEEAALRYKALCESLIPRLLLEGLSDARS